MTVNIRNIIIDNCFFLLKHHSLVSSPGSPNTVLGLSYVLCASSFVSAPPRNSKWEGGYLLASFTCSCFHIAIKSRSLGMRLGRSLGMRLGRSLGMRLGRSLGMRLGRSLGMRLAVCFSYRVQIHVLLLRICL